MKSWATIAIAMCATQPGASWIIPVVNRATRSTALQAQPTAGTGTGPSLQYNPEKYTDDKNAGNYRRLSEALEVCDLFMCLSPRVVPTRLRLGATCGAFRTSGCPHLDERAHRHPDVKAGPWCTTPSSSALLRFLQLRHRWRRDRLLNHVFVARCLAGETTT